jgi:uncharacterized damage-inducible protein DinB
MESIMKAVTLTPFLLLAASLLEAREPVQLFNGKDLTGWQMIGPGHFSVEHGALRTHGGMGLLAYSGRKFGNETLRIVYKTTKPADNSGVYIRLPEFPKDAYYGVHYGYEVQIDGEDDDFHATGAIYSLSKVSKQSQKNGDWNTLEIQLDGPITRVKLNGELINEYKPGSPVPDRKLHHEPVRGPRPDYGYIGLQNHDAESTVYFKEISVVTPGEKISDRDRNFLLSHLHSSKRMLGDAVRGLSVEQLNYKPSPDKWSIAEVVDHLIKTEPLLLGNVYALLRMPVDPNAKSPVTNEAVLAQMTDRSKKAEAPPQLQPKPVWTTAEQLLEEFEKRRERSLDFARNTQDDLLHRVRKVGEQEMSVYQFVLYLPGHTMRHLAQIEEVKAAPGFPKK